ncbi:MAG: NAD-dependent epimerase/dehydratase family protein [Candidatus Eisenbacteria bacterium]
MGDSDRLLVTGATGFVGRWVLRHWAERHPDVEVWTTSEQPRPSGFREELYRRVDLGVESEVRALVAECRPSAVVHLASLMVGGTLADHLDINVLGTERLYRALADECGRVRVVQVGSAAMYGRVRPDEIPITEDTPFRPVTDYALSKAAQDHLAHAMALGSDLEIVRARFFNILGPGQPDHLVPATFVSQLRRMSVEGSSRLRVGLVSARRDFLDVRDAVAALDTLLADGANARAYNVASATDRSVEEVIRILLEVSSVPAEIETEEDRLRAVEVPVVRADITRITEETEWRPSTPIERTLEDMWNAGGTE